MFLLRLHHLSIGLVVGARNLVLLIDWVPDRKERSADSTFLIPVYLLLIQIRPPLIILFLSLTLPLANVAALLGSPR